MSATPHNQDPPPTRMECAGSALIILGGFALLASAVIGGEGDLGSGIIAGLLNPIFFIGVPLGIYLLRKGSQDVAARCVDSSPPGRSRVVDVEFTVTPFDPVSESPANQVQREPTREYSREPFRPPAKDAPQEAPAADEPAEKPADQPPVAAPASDTGGLVVIAGFLGVLMGMALTLIMVDRVVDYYHSLEGQQALPQSTGPPLTPIAQEDVPVESSTPLAQSAMRPQVRRTFLRPAPLPPTAPSETGRRAKPHLEAAAQQSPPPSKPSRDYQSQPIRGTVTAVDTYRIGSHDVRLCALWYGWNQEGNSQSAFDRFPLGWTTGTSLMIRRNGRDLGELTVIKIDGGRLAGEIAKHIPLTPGDQVVLQPLSQAPFVKRYPPRP